MRCVECGKEIPERERCCSFCGAVQHTHTYTHLSSSTPTTTHCVKCGKLLSRYATKCCYCGAVQSPSNSPTAPSAFNCSSPQPPYYSQKELPMKWYKFLIYFYLFANAIEYFYNFIMSVNNATIFTNDRRLGDLVFAVFYLGMAVYSLITRNALAKYKEIGPRLLLGSYIIIAIASVINILVFSDRLSGTSDDIFIALLISVFTELIMYACNAAYFKKRDHLFKY